MILPRQVNLAILAYLQHQADEEAEIQARVIKARELYNGYIDDDLADVGAEIFIGQDDTDVEGVNLISIAIDTIVRRITLQKFVLVEPSDMGEDSLELDDSQRAELEAWMNRVYEVNKLSNLSRDLHRATERDGEAFVLVDYDLEYIYPRNPKLVGIPRIYIHERYTSAENSWKGNQGTNEGLKAHYRNNDVNQELDMVSKRWIEEYWEDDEIKQRQRMTLYIAQVGSELVGDLMPARIEKYELDDSGEWVQYSDPEDLEWPIWWTENQTEAGLSLPLPVIHFRNERFEPGQKKLWGLQTSMDQQWIAFNNAELVSGHQILVALGFYPTTDGKPPEEDGSNLMKAAPRQIIGTQAKTPREADVKAIPPASVEPLLNGLDKTAIYASFVGSLPVSNFIFSKSVASSETLKQGDAELVASVNELKSLWRESWSQVFDIARKMENIFNSKNLLEEPKIIPQFSPAERRDMNHLQKEAQAKREAGVPEEQILIEIWDYTPEQARKFLEMNLLEHQRGIGPEAINLQLNNGNEEQQSNEQTQETEPSSTAVQEHGNSVTEQLTTTAQQS